MDLNPCPIPGRTDCATTNRVGPLLVGAFGNRAQATLQGGSDRTNEDREYPVYSGFAEVNLPIFESLQANFSARWEKFLSDVTENDNEVFVPAGSIRWQVNEMLALRFTAGKTFSNVDPPEFERTNATTNLQTQFGGSAIVPTTTYANTDIKPEIGFNYNVGAIFSLGNFSATLDYYNIEIEDYVGRTLTANALVNAALQTPGSTGNPLLNCASPLLAPGNPELEDAPVIALNGACTATTRVSDIARITYVPTQNSGVFNTSGIDATARLRIDDVAGGVLNLSTDLTYQLTYEVSDLSFLGYSLAAGWEGLGSLNEDTAAGKNSQHVAEWRGSFQANYGRGPHNLNLTMRYVSSLIDDRTSQFIATAVTNTNPASTASCVAGSTTVPADAGAGRGPYNAACNVPILNGLKIPGYFTADVTYRVELPWDATASFTVANLFDEDPPFSRFGLSYDPYMGSPLGRYYRMSVTKRF